MLFIKKSIYRLDGNKAERLKDSLIKWSLDNRIYESNHWNANFDDLPCDGDEKFIARQWKYHINVEVWFDRKIVR